jgi:chromate reductase
MTTILGICGSLRGGSLNAALLRSAAQVIEGATLETGSIRGIPLYDGGLEASIGLPQAVVDLKARMVAADGVLLVTPEYNNGIPGVFKNAIDWMSRPASDIKSVFGDRPVAVIGASPGGFGTILAQDAWQARAAHARHAAVVRRAPDGVPRAHGVRRIRRVDRCRAAQAADRIPARLCRLRRSTTGHATLNRP